jgi:hypothetical protein
MTPAEARKITAMLATLYDVPAWTAERLKVFAQDIQDLDYAAAQAAAAQWRKTRRERPQPSDLRALVADTQLAMPSPEEAYGYLYDAIHVPRRRDHLHPAILEAVHRLGHDWDTLGVLQYEQYPWLRRDFLATYRDLRDTCRAGAQATGQLPLLPSRRDAQKALTAVHAQLESTGGNTQFTDEALGILRQTKTALQQRALQAELARQLTPEQTAARKHILQMQARELKEHES